MLYIGLKDLFFMTNNKMENIKGLMVSGHKELFLYDKMFWGVAALFPNGEGRGS